MAREVLNDEALDSVVGGFMHFNAETKVLTYTHEETGAVTQYTIKKYNKAWSMSNYYHAQGLHEDVIIGKMLDEGVIY